MAINFDSTNMSQRIIVREITHDLQQLSTTAAHYGVYNTQNITAPTRLKQFFAARIFLAQSLQLIELPEIVTEGGKPRFSDYPAHFSFSHSRNIVAIALSANREVGIDIQHFSPKAVKVRNKFLGCQEMALADTLCEQRDHFGDRVKVYTLFWCAKEAVYKLTNNKHAIAFKKNLCIRTCKPPMQHKGNLQVEFTYENRCKLINLNYLAGDDYVIVHGS